MVISREYILSWLNKEANLTPKNVRRVVSNIKFLLKSNRTTRNLQKIMALVLILALVSVGLVPRPAQAASQPILVTFSGQVTDDEGKPAATRIRAFLIPKGTGEMLNEPFATGTSDSETGIYVLKDAHAYGSPEIIDIAGYIDTYDFAYIVDNVGVSGGVSEYQGYFTPNEVVKDFQITKHGTVAVHITDMDGNSAPSGVPMWFSYTRPFNNDDTAWPENAPPSDGVSPKQITDASGTISMKLDASWSYDGGSLGGFIYAFPAGYRTYGGAYQTGALRYDWTDMADVSAHANKTVEYSIKVKPLGQILTRLEDSITGQTVSGADVNYTSVDPGDTSNQYNINKYQENTEDGGSVYALGPVNIEVEDPDDPGNNHLGHYTQQQTVSPVPWGKVPVTMKLEPHEPGVISGKVYDNNNNPVAGATVELLWDEVFGEGGVGGGIYKTIQQITSGTDGSYQFTGVVPTPRYSYTLRASKILYSASWQGYVYVSSDEITTADDFVLSPASSTVSITPSTFPIGQTASVKAEVKDEAGNPVADGTEVVLTTSRGTLTSGTDTGTHIHVLVSGGLVTAQLSSDSEGPGVVSLNNGEAVTSFEATAPLDITVPTWSTESSLTASDVSSSSLTLTWSAATDNVGVTEYRIYRDGSVIATVAGDVSTYNVSGLTRGTAYTFKVDAGDAAGNRSTAVESTATTLAGEAHHGGGGSPGGSGGSGGLQPTGVLLACADVHSDAAALVQAPEGTAVIIPEGTLPVNADGTSSTLTVTISQANQTADPGTSNPKANLVAYDPQVTERSFGPDGTKFAAPVTLTIPFGKANIDPADLAHLAIFLWKDGRWIKVGGKVDPVQQTISVTVSYFSTYRVMADRTQVPERMGGLDRYETAVEIAKNYFSAGADTVVLVRGDSSADALSAVPLAKNLNAPLLLTPPDRLPQDVLTEIKALGAKTVIIVGGEGAVNPQVATEITDQGITVQRVAGVDRYTTAYQVAQRLGQLGKAVLVNGADEAYPDALSISSWAAYNGVPILYTDGMGILPAATAQALCEFKVKRTFLVGGTAILPQSLENTVANPERYGGIDRYVTNAQVLSRLQPNPAGVFVATGMDFADVLAGAAVAGQSGAWMVLAGSDLSQEQQDILKSAKAGVLTYHGFGGTGVLPDTTLSGIGDLLGQ